MKEITRRLYTKPVMLGMAFLVVVGLLVGSFVTGKSRAASTFIPAGDDLFETTANGETYHNFAGANKIPAGFFNFDGLGTSHEFDDLVPLVGVPLTSGSDIDTIIHRNQDVFVPGSTSLTMTGLSLQSINSITVTYSDRPSEAWSVKVGLSAFKSSTGTMSFNSGGTFDSTLNVYPKFTFTRLSDLAEKTYDTGDPGGPGLMAQSSGSEEAVAEPVPEATIAPCPVVRDIESGATSATATSSCPPVTLTSTGNPWPITRPISEQELLASHQASPPGTKKKIAQAKVVGVQ